MVTHLMSRIESSVDSEVVEVGPGCFNVRTCSSRRIHQVSFGNESSLPKCSCEDWRHFRLQCKHSVQSLTSFLLGGGSNSAHFTQATHCSGYMIPAYQLLSKKLSPHVTQSHPDKECQEDALSDSEIGSVGELPPRRKSSLKQLQTKCRGHLKELINATYLLNDPAFLSLCETELKQLKYLVNDSLTSSDGIALGKQSTIKKRKGMKRKAPACSTTAMPDVHKKTATATLPQRKYGRRRHPHSKRYGKHAETMRKTFKVHVPVPPQPAHASMPRQHCRPESKKQPTMTEGQPPTSSDQRPPTSSDQRPPASSDQRPPASSDQRPPASSDQRPPASSDQRPPASSDQRPPASSDQRPPASSEQRPPASSDQRPPASSDQRPPASSDQRPPASSDQRPPASSEQRPPTSSDQRPPASSDQRPPARSDQRPPARSDQRPPASSDQRPSASGNHQQSECFPTGKAAMNKETPRSSIVVGCTRSFLIKMISYLQLRILLSI